ncbi:precorrin-6y C5,15-methyltransferase (decarboxylating) subunit CbiE [Odoribacter sp. OttesenSCG-928-J03]|nr:precorrin-6y C5,15-methyltransferase (decarboxylating) subunit CbiE [Odoribacter sp. OttesenSCG-928-J03]MDL2330531.1 precorrin-6y C5,15-methyltransferase (decarboxylating) subunit CbiE [Odoribacter sp. OttesenSCG-928-A06]
MNFYIIGIDDNEQQFFSDDILKILAVSRIFSGGVRHHEIVRKHLPQEYSWINISIPLENVFEAYRHHADIIVFASGDPLFFGFANTVQREFPDAKISLYPFFNSLQQLAHKMLMPYHDMHIVSLTGRPWHKFDEALIMGYDKIGVLTDNREHTPASIAKRMLVYGYDNYRMTVGELLGNQNHEKISHLSLEEASRREFSAPNNLILQKTALRSRYFGIPEKEFNLLNGRAKMITKMPVRLLSLSMLDLRDKAVFWDIGFCTGSVSIEAKLQFPHLQVIAFEQREEGRSLIEQNSCKFGTPGITSVIGDFTQADLSEFPQPDAVFIGGHGGKMMDIISILSVLLLPGSCIVFNAVSEESKQLFSNAVARYSFKKEQSTQIKIDDFNTIEVMKASR